MHVEPSDNFQSVKQRASVILKTEPGQIGLFTTEDKAKELVDLATVGDQEIQSEQIVYLVLRKGELCAAGALYGKFSAVAVVL